MYKKTNKANLVFIFAMSFSLLLLAGAAQPQEDPESSGNQPPYIDEMVESSQLTQSQVDNMRKDGQSWGNIRINARLAEQIAANNSDPAKTAEQKYQEGLNYVLQQRAAGRGFGDIARDNNISLGSVMRNDNAAQNQQKDKTQIQNQNKEQEQNKNLEQTQVQQQTQTKAKKKGLFGRVFGIFSKDKKEQKQETSTTTQTKKSSTKAKTQQDVSTKTQTENSSSSQNVKPQQRTETNQRTQMQTGNGSSRGGGRGK